MWHTMRNMCGIEMINGRIGGEGVTPFQGSDHVVGKTQGDALGYGVLHLWCDRSSAPKVHPPVSPRQRSGAIARSSSAPKVHPPASPGQRSGAIARLSSAPTVHPPASPGHRLGFRTAPDIRALKGRNPSIPDHFADANKMIESAHPGARELEERIAGNFTEILETV